MLIPGPRALPLLGARANFAAFVRDVPGHLRRMHERYGDIASLARGTASHVFVFSPEYNRAVLSDPALFGNIDAASTPVRMRPGSSLERLYAGLTNLNGDRHRRLRRVVSGALRRAHVEAYDADIVRITTRHLASWRHGETRDMLAETRVLTLAIAVKTLLGLEPERAAGVSALLQEWMDRVFSVPVMALPLDVPGLPYHRLQVLSGRLEGTVREIIARRRERPEATDVLSRLAGTELTDDELIGQAAFLFMAGHATTASALTWTLLLLAAHPEVARDLRDELAGTLRGAPPRAADLERLPLLDRVVRESLRLLPPVMWWGKVASAPCTIGPYAIDAGATVAFSPFVTHRRPELYPRPDRFEPERWAATEPGPYAYLPFSAGPRTCLGAGFAMLETRLVLANLLTRWRPDLPPGARVDRGGLMVSQPKHGLPVILRRPDDPHGGGEVTGDIRELIEFGATPKKFPTAPG